MSKLTDSQSGINVTGNFAEDRYNSTYLCGFQVTDDDGVAAFETVFPGHYTGRATHTYLIAHSNVTVFDNGTIQGRTVAQIGQLFWNEVLRSAVENTYPCLATSQPSSVIVLVFLDNTNTLPVVSNADDMWSIVQADNDCNPFPEFICLGEDITDGLLAWI
jgi:hypothetical protein